MKLIPCLSFFLAAMFALSSIDSASAHGKDLLVFISAFAPGDKGAIHAYRINSKSGAAKELTKTNDVEHPFFLALSRDRKYLYSIHANTFGGKNNEEVAAYRVVGREGRLALINRQSALGTAACYLDVDRSGKTLLVANYSTGSVASLPIGKDGALGKAASFFQHQGSSVTPRQKGPHAHCIVVSPDNRYAFAADLGLDKVLSYKIETQTAKLTPTEQTSVKTPAGAGPRHLTFHPNGKHIYVVNELSNSVTTFDYDTNNGSLKRRKTISTLPDDFKGTTYCADVKATSDGRYLYATNRGHDSLAMYSIQANGDLRLLGIQPSGGKNPQNLAITPDNRLLLCANMGGNKVTLFHIQDDGKLGALRQSLTLPSPSCIMIY